MNDLLVRSLAFVVIALSAAAQEQPASEPAQRVSSMAQAARNLLESLPTDLRDKATRPLADPERTSWNFVPGEYAGVQLGDLDDAQRALAHALLRTPLSTQGYLAVTTIISLETVLRELESRPGRDASHRDPLRYAILLFGEPGSAAWAWRLQGHHVSLRFCEIDGKVVAVTPAFLGANPATVRSGPRAGLRALGHLQELGARLFTSLRDAQRAEAVLPGETPRDVILGPTRAADFLGAPKGVAFADLDEAQRTVMVRILHEFAGLLDDEIAREQMERIQSRGLDGIRFAFAGSVADGEGQYWRLHGPTFVIEYDNTQNDANHVHTVWRDLERDFGEDLLRAHHETHPHPQPKKGDRTPR
jgi:hypothetical protein